MEYLVRDVVPRMPKNYRYSLIDIGLVINQLMGAGYRSSYTRRKFRLRYDYSQQQARLAEAVNSRIAAAAAAGGSAAHTPASAMSPSMPNKATPYHFLQKRLKKTSTESSFKIPTFALPGGSAAESPTGAAPTAPPATDVFMTETFDYPFSELIVWAVLTKRREMSRLVWQHGEQAMSKALVASRLCQAMADEAADDDLDVEIFDELTQFGKEFDELGTCTSHLR